ncbi:TetR/AcrR family transcriptional regulator [Streptomyces sp. NPDC003758]|uniref:TetR/AcrR family transcriptional regulator n=1 Tax=Streptomyces cynarae TaxID=2981134 RepID=A0ABY6EBN6_9ACTN|nr:TetR/AcrR family transcriptional regulator [Streptomyces cynarae]UXY24069.1 TetR/AcrR family transcriptional regulator [Streptomyces cynarae]
MNVPAESNHRKTTPRSVPRERLLATAARLFYTEGIRSVGVDRVVEEAQVTRATFYRHFPSKEDLVRAYLQAEDQRIRGRVAEVTAEAATAADALNLMLGGIGAEICGPGFRGCPFINAAAEYPDKQSPVHQAVLEHRSWFREAIAEILRLGDHPVPEHTADTLVALRDGAMVGGYLGDPKKAADSFRQAALALVADPRPART